MGDSAGALATRRSIDVGAVSVAQFVIRPHSTRALRMQTSGSAISRRLQLDFVQRSWPPFCDLKLYFCVDVASLLFVAVCGCIDRMMNAVGVNQLCFVVLVLL